MNRKQRRAALSLGQTARTFPPASTPGVAALFGRGLQHHQAGQLAEAEVFYRQVLAVQSDHADALHLLGVIASQVGRHEIAVELIGQAIRHNRSNSLYYSNQGLAFQALKRLEDALQSYDRALAWQPDYAEALFNRGVTLQALERFEQALKSYDCALLVSPSHAEAFSNRGVVLQKLRRFDEAIKSCDRALSAVPAFVEALSNRGNALVESGRVDDALESYELALTARPGDAEVLYNRANTLRTLDRLSAALENYDRALGVRPGYVETLSNRGAVLQALGQPDAAAESYGAALALVPDFVEALSNRGNAFKELGRLDEALENYQRALAVRPYHAEALFNRGVVLHEVNRLDDAIESYDCALAARPDHAGALSNRGDTLQKLRRLDDALNSYDCALAVNAEHAEALSNRGNVLKELRRFEDALEGYHSALTVRPDYPEALSNRGLSLQALMRFEDALENYDRALTMRPNFIEALSNRGGALQEMKRFDDALESYDRALALAPDYVEAQFNRALLLLLTGALSQGWTAYESRRRLDSWVRRDFPNSEWSGGSLAGKRLLLYAEQGFGDTIQFVRYALLAAAQGAQVILEVQPSLKTLFTELTCLDVVAAGCDPLPPFDLHCPLLSLPRVFATTAATIPADIPYLQPPAARLEAVKTLPPPDMPLVGLAWSGHPKNTKDYDRSIGFAQLAPLLSISGARFVSLQKDVRTEGAAAFAECGKVIDLQAELKDFADTAAVISQLDLVITVDTAVAHLAGAMGKPVWILLPCIPDFRWLLDRGDSPWYPTARLFRKDQAGEWGEVIARVAMELAVLLPSLRTKSRVFAHPDCDVVGHFYRGVE